MIKVISRIKWFLKKILYFIGLKKRKGVLVHLGLNKNIIKVLSRIKWFLNFFPYFIGLKKRKGVLVYLGLNKGESFFRIFYRYKICYGFEANPKLYYSLLQKYKMFPYVHIYNKAVSNTNGEVQFNISSNNGISSSIGTFKKEWKHRFQMVKTITVPSINLMDFLNEQDIDFIDNYISDIQGFDLEVLKTLKPMIDERKIGSMVCEIAKDKYGNIYKNAPDNSLKGFKSLLSKNYICVSTGWGAFLKDGVFNNVPEEWWEFDSKWRLKEEKKL